MTTKVQKWRDSDPNEIVLLCMHLVSGKVVLRSTNRMYHVGLLRVCLSSTGFMLVYLSAYYLWIVIIIQTEGWRYLVSVGMKHQCMDLPVSKQQTYPIIYQTWVISARSTLCWIWLSIESEYSVSAGNVWFRWRQDPPCSLEVQRKRNPERV